MRIVLGYAPHRQMVLTRSIARNGRLAVVLHVPVVKLQHGRGTATVSVSATAGRWHATAAQRLLLSDLVLSVNRNAIRGCQQALTVRIAYFGRANTHLTITYSGHKPYDARLTTDRHGLATSHLTISYVHSRSKGLTIVVLVRGQHGSSQQTEQVRLNQAVPGSCRA